MEQIEGPLVEAIGPPQEERGSPHGPSHTQNSRLRSSSARALSSAPMESRMPTEEQLRLELADVRSEIDIWQRQRAASRKLALSEMDMAPVFIREAWLVGAIEGYEQGQRDAQRLYGRRAVHPRRGSVRPKKRATIETRDRPQAISTTDKPLPPLPPSLATKYHQNLENISRKVPDSVSTLVKNGQQMLPTPESTPRNINHSSSSRPTLSLLSTAHKPSCRNRPGTPHPTGPRNRKLLPDPVEVAQPAAERLFHLLNDPVPELDVDVARQYVGLPPHAGSTERDRRLHDEPGSFAAEVSGSLELLGYTGFTIEERAPLSPLSVRSRRLPHAGRDVNEGGLLLSPLSMIGRPRLRPLPEP
ncbi:hypothetical protein C8R47DRAFT_11108 [Mycena vitilis]|nr:hypothetical protein C8R47DRAFT_460389 [Mycena vitilis]KAJ6509145.1 hypothetical protein C8R47DRAFT_11108 [Mycena vitilis]